MLGKTLSASAGLVLLLSSQSNDTGEPRSVNFRSELVDRIPPRRVDAVCGSAFASGIRHLKGRARDEAVLSELSMGNLPPFLRELQPVELSGRDSRGKLHRAIVFVTPDYLAVGSNENFVRVPLGFEAAAVAGRRFGMSLPTRKIVDAIYEQSSLRLAPKPMSPGPRMTSTDYFVEHNRIIEQQRRGQPRGPLVSGHKKDLVLTKRLLSRRGRVAIYGWHRARNRPIQPLSTVHGARYADYSHGIRLVSTTIVVDGERRSLFETLADPELAPVLTYEGVIRDAAKLIGAPRAPQS